MQISYVLGGVGVSILVWLKRRGLLLFDSLSGWLIFSSRPLSGNPTMAMSPELDAVQRLIITQHREQFDESPSPMKVQKLCYYAQGYLLAQGHELFPEDFQAWQHGPVVPALYQRYRSHSWRGVSDEMAFTTGELPSQLAEEITDIVAAYGRYDGAALSTMTHREEPWMDARGNADESESSTSVIPKSSLRAFFRMKLDSHEE